MTTQEFIKKAEQIAKGVPVYYGYGFTGQVLSDASIQARAKQYPNWYTADRIKELKKHNGCTACDCSGLIKWVLKEEMFPDFNADYIFSVYCTKVDKPYAGCLAHKKGHIGIVINDTEVVEASSSKGKVVISNIKDRDFTEYGKFNYLKEVHSKGDALLEDLKALIKKYGG